MVDSVVVVVSSVLSLLSTRRKTITIAATINSVPRTHGSGELPPALSPPPEGGIPRGPWGG
ncbi:MAG: hypothetical protein M5U19_04155 [Microthrixaceae bacterium]|nr:hypothetical protein [Microthrixaceae bacterium]